MANTNGLFKRGVVAEVEVTENHQSFFTLTDYVVIVNQKVSTCESYITANMREDHYPLPPPFPLFYWIDLM